MSEVASQQARGRIADPDGDEGGGGGEKRDENSRDSSWRPFEYLRFGRSRALLSEASRRPNVFLIASDSLEIAARFSVRCSILHKRIHDLAHQAQIAA